VNIMKMKGSHLFWLSKGMTVDIWIRGYNPPRRFQKKISGRVNIVKMKGSHLFRLSRSTGMTVDIWIRDYNPPRCFQ
jgi:hypothetical protein